MFDMSDSQDTVHALYESFSGEKRGAYGRVIGSGSDMYALSLRAGVVASMRQSSDMSVRLCIGRQKGRKWRVSRDTVPDFGFLPDRAQHFRGMEASAEQESDPRPVFKGETLPNGMLKALYHYDSAVGMMHTPLVFHRAFGSFSHVLEEGFLVDADMNWRQGGFLYNGQSKAFAYIDNYAYYFAPQTQIEMSACIYHGAKPYLRRFIRHTSWKLNDIYDCGDVLESMKSSVGAPLLAWNAHNIERMVLMPGAAADLIEQMIPLYWGEKQADRGEKSVLSPRLVFESDPNFGLYSPHGASEIMPMLDARGHKVQKTVLIEDGLLKGRPVCDLSKFARGESDNGHAADTSGRVDILCPVLRGVESGWRVDNNGTEMPGIMTPESFSKNERGKILCIEKLHIRRADGVLHIEAPYGAVLCRDGICLGHVVPPAAALRVEDLLGFGKSAGDPVRVGAMAVCPIEVML